MITREQIKESLMQAEKILKMVSPMTPTQWDDRALAFIVWVNDEEKLLDWFIGFVVPNSDGSYSCDEKDCPHELTDEQKETAQMLRRDFAVKLKDL